MVVRNELQNRPWKKDTSDLKLLENKKNIDKTIYIYKNINPVRSRPGSVYWLGNVQEESKSRLCIFQPPATLEL